MPNKNKSNQELNDWFPQQVLNWAQVHGRHSFPWQAPHTAYKTWISEIMLQQTQASRVVDFFNAFMARFPDVHSLAEAQEDTVFHLWSGLGYYTRAQNILKAARLIVKEHNGEVPQNLEDLISLPGIGRSTAGAIRSLGHGLEGSILDGNVRRVLGRFAMIDGKPQSKPMEEAYWNLVDEVTPHKKVDDRHFNQAMMDLGATLCTIKNPACHRCPLAKRCKAFKEQQTENFPVTMAKYKKRNPETVKARRVEKRYYLCIHAQSEILLYKRPPTGIWRNLWCPMEFMTLKELQTAAEELTGIDSSHIKAEEHIFHQFSHFDLEFMPYSLNISKHRHEQSVETNEAHRFLWYNTSSPQDIGLASPVMKLLKHLKQNQTIPSNFELVSL